ncbi:MAG: APH(3') family aminoglycoside O-phosphotransferase [Ktedonobacterales bacterium]
MTAPLPLDIPALPAGIARDLAGGIWEAVTIGASGAQVYRVTWPAASIAPPTRYLKLAPHAAASLRLADELRAEERRLRWLQGRLPAPRALAYAEDQVSAYLLLSEVPGVMSCDPVFAADPVALTRLLAEGLRLIHQMPTADCPFDARLASKIAEAERRVRAGVVAASDFDSDHLGKSPINLFAQLLATRPADEDLVFTHGDYCLPNVLIDQADPAHGRISGLIDWGRAGVADRYQDIALATRSLTYNFGPGLEPLLWQAYGLTAPDHDKITFYRLLDEFF